MTPMGGLIQPPSPTKTGHKVAAFQTTKLNKATQLPCIDSF